MARLHCVGFYTLMARSLVMGFWLTLAVKNVASKLILPAPGLFQIASLTQPARG